MSLAVAFLATWLFAALLDAVFDKASMVRWDMAMARSVHSIVTPGGLRIFRFVTNLGSPVSVTCMTIVACALLFRRGQTSLSIMWVATVGGGAALVRIVKIAVHRTRPEYAGHYLVSGSYSFPSGHAALSFLGVSMLIYTLIGTNHLTHGWTRNLAVAAGAIFVLLVGLSRIYLGVHFPSDVLGGYAIAAAWFSACAALSRIKVRGRLSPTDADKTGRFR